MRKVYRIIVVGVYIDSRCAVKEMFVLSCKNKEIAKRIAIKGYDPVWSISVKIMYFKSAKLIIKRILERINRK